MRHVEEAGAGARVEMLGEHARRILHRHVVAGEGHHAGAERHMGAVQRRRLQRRRRRAGLSVGGLIALGFVFGFGHRHSRVTDRCAARRLPCRCAPPLSRDLRDFTCEAARSRDFAGLPPSVSRTMSPAAFQSASSARSFCLSVSGAVTPSAPRRTPERPPRSLPRGSTAAVFSSFARFLSTRACPFSPLAAIAEKPGALHGPCVDMKFVHPLYERGWQGCAP